jgi:hypothetical protein
MYCGANASFLHTCSVEVQSGYHGKPVGDELEADVGDIEGEIVGLALIVGDKLGCIEGITDEDGL